MKIFQFKFQLLDEMKNDNNTIDFCTQGVMGGDVHLVTPFAVGAPFVAVDSSARGNMSKQSKPLKKR